ncbi:hypothetical protein SEA_PAULODIABOLI_312 [Microbacterium phage PauloDiaboli]|nr:hypothetical protein SEA_PAULODIABOLI_312 [Microbacterium phage PauloDiaboli]QWY84119.1 hypothetical protein SEA_A3WALLY_312 [Microbacterium phage A3Wally]
MSYVIDPTISAEKREELLDVTDEELEAAEAFFKNAELSQGITIDVANGHIRLRGGPSIEFVNYKGKVSAMFDTTDGDRIYLTEDGGMINVTELLGMLRKAVSDARV